MNLFVGNYTVERLYLKLLGSLEQIVLQSKITANAIQKISII